MSFRPNNCVQATPSCALCLFLSQGLGAPDAERWVKFSRTAKQ